MAKVAQNLPVRNTTSCTSHRSVVAAHTSIVTPVRARARLEAHLDTGISIQISTHIYRYLQRLSRHLRPSQLMPGMEARSAGSSMPAVIMKER